MKTHDSNREDVIKLIQEKNIKIINLCHIPEDCRLKTLSFTTENKERLHQILEFGERVDGSSLFSYIDPDRSDIYITPRLESAFINPFSSMPTLNVLCKYLNEHGKPLDVAPENILLRAEEKLHASAGIILKALAELEFYIVRKQEETVFPRLSEGNYHESTPYARSEDLRNKVLVSLADIGIATKYGHAEVGRFRSKSGHMMEQHEIEFQSQKLGKMAETVAIAKWVIRNICAKYGVSVSFSPKLALEHAGNGMHIHLCALRKNKNIVGDSKGNLTIEAKQMIGGLLKFASSLTAFGNTIPISYLRFISRKESPMQICWGTRNRLALVRIPLWWSFRGNSRETDSCRQTFEYRAPDASANTYLLLAGIAAAIEYGLKNPKEATKTAEDLHTENVAKKVKEYKLLPQSCDEAAKNLERDRNYYEADGVFPTRVIDGIITKLGSYEDKGLWKKLAGKPDEIHELLWKYFHSG